MLRTWLQSLDAHLAVLAERLALPSVARWLRRPEVGRFVRFLFVGGINTLFGYSLFCALLYVGLHYALAGLISTVLGVVFNFFTTGGIVFDNRDPRKLVRFSLGYVILYVIGLGEMHVAKLLHWNLYVVAFALLLPNAVFGYLLNKTLVFATRPAQAGAGRE